MGIGAIATTSRCVRVATRLSRSSRRQKKRSASSPPATKLCRRKWTSSTRSSPSCAACSLTSESTCPKHSTTTWRKTTKMRNPTSTASPQLSLWCADYKEGALTNCNHHVLGETEMNPQSLLCWFNMCKEIYSITPTKIARVDLNHIDSFMYKKSVYLLGQ